MWIRRYALARQIRCVLPALMAWSVLSASGCRTPPWNVSGGPPDFDQLIEIERQQSSGAAPREPLANRFRPGGSSRATGASSSRATENLPAENLSSDSQSAEQSLAADTSPDAATLAGSEDATLAAAASSNSSPRGAYRKFSDQADDSQPSDAADQEALLAGIPATQREMIRREMLAMRQRGAAGLETAPAEQSATQPQSASEPNSPAPPRANAELPAAVQSASHIRNRASEVEVAAAKSAPQSQSKSGYVGSSKYQLAGNDPAAETASRTPPGESQVVEAGYADSQQPTRESAASAAAQLDWRENIYQALEGLKNEPTAASPEEQIHREMVTRLLHLSLGDVNSASEPIDGLQNHGQDFIRHSLEALYEATNPQGNPVEVKRYTLAMLSQRKALQHLAAVSNLEVLNPAFCTEVDGFGVITKFPQYSFRPDQELLLYCELDNFVSTHIEGKGFETQLQGSYEIVDSAGRRIADQLLPMDSHLCRNQRRDYFIAYRIYVPQKIEPGKYQLKLVVEDLKGRKFGQNSLDFEVKL